MKLRVLALIVLVVGALPAATAYAPSTADSSALNDREVSSVQDSASATETTEASENDSDESTADYTKLYVESDYDHPQLKPGEQTEFTVTVKNGEDSAVTLDPHVYVPPVGQNLLDESWVSIDGDATVAADAETEFTVTVSVPENAEIGRYAGQIAFTDETVAYPGSPDRPIHAASVNVRVWKEPTVNVVSSTYIRGQVEAGDSTTKQIVVENTGDEAVPLSPQLKGEHGTCYGDCPSELDPSWLDIDAPSSVGPGETETVTVTVSPPESADSNNYRGELELGLKDPNRDERNGHWQEINLRFDVWNQPDEPFETTFEVSEDADDVTLTLSPRSDSESANFDVALVGPDGDTVTPERVRVSDGGFIDLSDAGRTDVERQGEYAVNSAGQTFVYRVDDPDAGTWTLRVMPENVIGFNYEVVRNESAA